MKKLLALTLVLATGSMALVASDEPSAPGWYQSRWGGHAHCGLLDHHKVVREIEEQECRGGFEYRYMEVGGIFSGSRTKCMKAVNFGSDDEEDWIAVRQMGNFFCDKVGKDIDRAIRDFDEGKLLDF